MLSNSDSLGVHPENNVFDFIVNLPKHIILEGAYKCAIVDCNIKITGRRRNTDALMYIFCDLCQDNFVRDTYLPILKVMECDEGNQTLQYPLYIPVKVTQFHQIHIYIRNHLLETPALNLSSFNCTLHLKKS